MRFKKIIIFFGIVLILTSFFILTLIYPFNANKTPHFFAEFVNINYNIHNGSEFSYIELPDFFFNQENATVLLTNDLRSNMNSNIGLLTTGGARYFAFSKEPIENGLYAIDDPIYHDSVSIKGTKTTVIEITKITKVNQTLNTDQKIYKIMSIVFFILGFSIIILYILKNDLNSEGKLLIDQGKFVEAIELYNKTLEIDPDDETAIVNIGRTYTLLGKFDKAKIYYDKAIELYPKSSWVWYSRGWSYYHKNDHEEAIKCFEKATELNSEYDNAYYGMACAFSLKNDADKAIQSLKKAIEFSKTSNILKAKNNKDFDNIRDKPEFINLINYK